MNAAPVLRRIAEGLAEAGLEAVMIGNAAAALQGAPVTTLDAVILQPYYPVSSLYRVTNDDAGLQVDFMGHIHGVRSFESLRSRASTVTFGEASLQGADLADIVRSKPAAGRQRDRAVLPVLEATLREKKK